MKRSLFLIFLFLSVSISFAQTQQGIVKTRGRMVNGKLVAGQKLSGVTITLNIGNPLVSGLDGEDGVFSFNVPSGKEYALVSATKQGYTLADPEFIYRSFSYSANNPFYVVLEDEAQRQADINVATRNVRKRLTAQLQAREDEIEALKKQHKLTEEEYQKKLQKLYDNQSKSEQLVPIMAERYVSTDYDQLDDEFSRLIQMYIEEGELQKADSMIRSKGSLTERVKKYHNTVLDNNKNRVILENKLKELERSEMEAAKTYAKLSQDLFFQHEIYMLQFNQDSALFCLKQRADLDTTQLAPLEDYAKLCMDQTNYLESEKYYQMCLNSLSQKKDTLNISITLRNIGNIHFILNSFDKAEYYLKSAFEYLNSFSLKNSAGYWITLSSLYGVFGELYKTKNDSLAEDYLLKSLKIVETLNDFDSTLFVKVLADAQIRLGNFYVDTCDKINSEKYLTLSINNYEKLYENNPELYLGNLAIAQYNLCRFYLNIKDYVKGYHYLNLAFTNFESLFNRNPAAYRENYASVLLVEAQEKVNFFLDYEPGKTWLEAAKDQIEQSLEHFNILNTFYPDKYLESIAFIYLLLGDIDYYLWCDYVSIPKYKLSLEYYEKLYKTNPDKYLNQLADIYTTLVLVINSYNKQYLITNYGDYIEKAYQLQMEINPNIKNEIISNPLKNYRLFTLMKLYSEYFQNKGQ